MTGYESKKAMAQGKLAQPAVINMENFVGSGKPVVFNDLTSLKHKKTVGPIESAMRERTPDNDTHLHATAWIGDDMKAVIEVTDCRDCPYAGDHRGHGECWTECRHPQHNQGAYGNILWGCQAKFTAIPSWCPLKEKNNG